MWDNSNIQLHTAACSTSDYNAELMDHPSLPTTIATTKPTTSMIAIVGFYNSNNIVAIKTISFNLQILCICLY